VFASFTKQLHLNILAITLALGACVHSSVIPLSQDTLQITAAAAPACGITGAQNYAARLAGVETLRHGYDRYAIVGGQYQNDVHVVGYTPVVAQTSSTGTVYSLGNTASINGHSTTVFGRLANRGRHARSSACGEDVQGRRPCRRQFAIRASNARTRLGEGGR
jgi:hypothetical protein